MKKKTGIIILIFALVAAMLTGCGSKEKETVPYDYDLNEYVEVVDYHNMPYRVKTAEVTDEDVENEIKSRLEYAATVVNSTEGVVEDGDTINIAFAGRIDGELFEGGSSESYDLTVGTTSMIDGFVEGLVGKKVGETVTLDLQFPEEYHSAEVAGKPVVFEVTINSKRIVSTPEFNDEFVQNNSEFQTVDEYRANVKETLIKSAQERLDAQVKDSLWEVIIAKSEALKYPDAEMTEANGFADAMEADYKNQASLYGMEWTDFLSTFMGTDESGFAEMKDEYAKSLVLSEMVMYKIARAENVQVTQKEFEDKAKEILASSNFTEESFEATYGMSIVEYAEQNGWKESFLLEKIMDKVIEYGREVSDEEFTEYVNTELGRNVEVEAETEAEVTTETEGEEPEAEEGGDAEASSEEEGSN